MGVRACVQWADSGRACVQLVESVWPEERTARRNRKPHQASQGASITQKGEAIKCGSSSVIDRAEDTRSRAQSFEEMSKQELEKEIKTKEARLEELKRKKLLAEQKFSNQVPPR